MNRFLAVALSLVAVPAVPAIAQQSSERPPSAVEIIGGYAGFVDDATIDHGVIGGSARFYLSPRISVGPEIVYMRGPADDRDLFFTGNLTFDVLTPGPDRRVTPFLVAGGGLFRGSYSIGPQPFSYLEGAFTAGGGIRAPVSERWHALGEYRIGWELHQRVTGGVGVTW